MKKVLRQYMLPFISGFLATLVFHQGVIAILFYLKIIPISPFNLSPTPPLGVPAVISLSFFGGLWGIIVWAAACKSSALKQVLKLIILGAIGPTAVAFLIVFPLKGIAVNWGFIPLGLLLNGFWGLGVWCFMRFFLTLFLNRCSLIIFI